MDIFLKLQEEVEDWDKLRCVMCFWGMLNALITNTQIKASYTTPGLNIYLWNLPYSLMR